jgi:hypothetical protein
LVDTRWQQYSTHLHTNSTQNTENGTYRTIKKIWKCWPCPVFESYTLAFALQLRKKHGKTSVRIVEKCPDIPVTAVQYIFTHKQHTEHREQNIHNNKKKKLGSEGRGQSSRVIQWHLPYNLGKSTANLRLWVRIPGVWMFVEIVVCCQVRVSATS